MPFERWLYTVPLRLRSLFRGKRVDDELDDEMQYHLERAIERNIAEGMPPRQARHAALRAMEGLDQRKEQCRDARGVGFIENMVRDLRFGTRQLRRTPGFTAIAILTLALGIGANTAIFSVMNAVVLRFLPVREPSRLIYLHTKGQASHTSQTGYDDTSLQEPVYEQLRNERAIFSDVMAYVPLAGNKVAVRYGSEPEEAQGDMVSGNFFPGLGVNMARGRAFRPEDESRHTQVAVLSESWWTRRFARNPSVLGDTLYVKGVPFTIVGVAAPGFAGVEHGKATDFWVPLQNRPDLKPWGAPAQEDQSLYGSPGWLCLMVMARLAPGVTEKEAQARANPIFQRAAYSGIPAPDPKEVKPVLYFSSARGIPGLRDDYEHPLTMLMMMVALVLLIACANVAMLLLARNNAREREFSLRMALGGSRRRLFRQLLTESLLLVGAGASLGWLFALSATRALAAWTMLDVDLSPDYRVLAFTVAVSLAAALVFGLAPLRSIGRIPMGLALKTAAAASRHDRRKVRTSQAIVALQMALCLVLLVGASLLVRTLYNLQNANLGLRASGLFVFGISPQKEVASDTDAVRFYRALLDRLRMLPGVESATIMQNRIGAGWSNNTHAYVDGHKPRDTKSSSMRWNAVGADYFHVLGVPILLGRDFSDSDAPGAPNVAIVNQEFVNRYLGGRDPLGHQISFADKAEAAVNPPWIIAGRSIIGVVANNKYTSVRERVLPMAYFPYTQIPGIGSMNIELRTRGNAAALLPEVRRSVTEFAPDLPLMEPTTQQEQFERSFTQERVFARLALFFGVLATLLVATGLYGSLAYKVSRRTAEIGVRMALGARRGQVLWLVLRESLVLGVVGVAAGLPLALGIAKLLRSMLFGLEPADPMSFAGALIGITIVAVAASLIPARRAATVDPIVALRYE